ncbi:MFS transporter [Luteococcus japonicus]|uniref:MFS transporter n=1 Tax=Luteococcus japonicus TaxID=33984 RepID=A0A3N1ZQC0_9ACTN|nr:MFS transporter [Luteococcus japonicus]
MFSTPAGISERTAIAWILLFDAAFQLRYSFVNIPYGSLSGRLHPPPAHGGLRQAQGLCRAGRGGRAGLCGDLPGARRSLPVAVIAWFLFGAGTGGTNAMMFSMRADSVDYGEWKTDIRSEGGSYSILSFIRKCGQGIGGAMGAAIIGAFGYVAKAPTRSPDVLHGIRLAAGGAPAVLAVAAVAVMFFYPLTATEHRSLVAELNECRTRRAAGETLGLDAEELGVVQLGDGRSLRLTRSDAPVIPLFEREGPGGTEIGSKVAQALGVGFTGQRFSSREISQLDDDVVTPNGFDRFVRSLSCPARRSPHWPRPWRSPWTTVWQTRPLERCWKPSATVAS